MSRYLVTGATGFLGSHLTDHLLQKGHEVVALCRPNPANGGRPSRPAAPAPLWEGHAGVTVALGDILDTESVVRAATGTDGVFHCAGKVSRKAADAELLYRTHVDGTKSVLAACKKAGVPRLVLASTSGTIAVSKEPEVRNERAAVPNELIGRWPYYRTKLYAETIALEQNGADLKVISVNPSLLLGPGDIHGSSTGDVELFLSGKVPVIPAGGLSFVDVRDVAPAMISAMERGTPGARYLMAGANMTLEAFFGRLSRISGVEKPKLKAPRNLLMAKVGATLFERAKKYLPLDGEMERASIEMGQVFWYCDSTRAVEELGFAPRDPGVTLADTLSDLEERGVVWPKRGPRSNRHATPGEDIL